MTPSPVDNPAPDATAVRVCSVTKSFGTGDSRTVALKGTDFTSRRGELHLVVGPSGCGKTTLLSVIAGTLTWDSGTVEVLGTRLDGMAASALTAFRGRHIGFVFQQFNLIPTLDCAENVAVPLLINGVGRRGAVERARAALAGVGLADKADRRPSELSGGQQQRVAIARALVHEPALLICDEPTSALDSTTGHTIMELLAGVARGPDRCVLIVTHDPRTYAYADRLTEMEDGRVRGVHQGGALAAFIQNHR